MGVTDFEVKLPSKIYSLDEAKVILHIQGSALPRKVLQCKTYLVIVLIVLTPGSVQSKAINLEKVCFGHHEFKLWTS